MDFLTKEEKIIYLTTKESDELNQYDYCVIERDGYAFFIRRQGYPEKITATLINYVVIKNN